MFSAVDPLAGSQGYKNQVQIVQVHRKASCLTPTNARPGGISIQPLLIPAGAGGTTKRRTNIVQFQDLAKPARPVAVEVNGWQMKVRVSVG